MALRPPINCRGVTVRESIPAPRPTTCHWPPSRLPKPTSISNPEQSPESRALLPAFAAPSAGAPAPVSTYSCAPSFCASAVYLCLGQWRRCGIPSGGHTESKMAKSADALHRDQIPARAPALRSELNTVIPAHIKGAASAAGSHPAWQLPLPPNHNVFA